MHDGSRTVPGEVGGIRNRSRSGKSGGLGGSHTAPRGTVVPARPPTRRTPESGRDLTYPMVRWPQNLGTWVLVRKRYKVRKSRVGGHMQIPRRDPVIHFRPEDESLSGLVFLLFRQYSAERSSPIQKAQRYFFALPFSYRNILLPVGVGSVRGGAYIVRILLQPSKRVVPPGIRVHHAWAHARRRLTLYCSRRNRLSTRTQHHPLYRCSRVATGLRPSSRGYQHYEN